MAVRYYEVRFVCGCKVLVQTNAPPDVFEQGVPFVFRCTEHGPTMRAEITQVDAATVAREQAIAADVED